MPRWIICKAAWNNYWNTVNIPENINTFEEPCKIIPNILLDSAILNIPKSKSRINTKFSNCWWIENCDIVTENANKQYNNV